MKEKNIEEVEVKTDLTIEDEDNGEDGAEIKMDVKKEIDKIVEVFNNLKDTAQRLKGAEVKMKDWTFLVSHSEGEYTVEFRMKLSVKPKYMESTQ